MAVLMLVDPSMAVEVLYPRPNRVVRLMILRLFD